jgi:hypothetical protein
MSSFLITRYSRIDRFTFRDNGEFIFRLDGADASSFLKSAYRHLGISYPKFFKMDNLCKLAFLAAEPLMSDGLVKERYADNAVGIILQNSSSSLTTDERHQESIADSLNYYPSPSVFVYTLPNIMIGEIAIRHRIKGENAVFLTPAPDPLQLYNTVCELFTNNRIECCLAGWVEEYHETLSACLFRVEKSPALISSVKMGESIIFEPSNIERLYKDAL